MTVTLTRKQWRAFLEIGDLVTRRRVPDDGTRALLHAAIDEVRHALDDDRAASAQPGEQARDDRHQGDGKGR